MDDDRVATYPAQYETEVLLKDGSRIRLRPIRREDTGKCFDFISRLSPQERRLRFRHVSEAAGLDDATRFCQVDYNNTFAVVAEAMRDGHSDIVAVARFYRLPRKDSAEIISVVEEDYQGKGLGTHLLNSLASAARSNNISTFEADILPDNEAALAVLRDYGFHITSEWRDGVYHVTFPIVRTGRVIRKEEERERISTVASLESILRPHSVAVIGASRDPNSIGNILVQCILQSGFTGVLYPVNPRAEAVLSVKAYPSVLDIPGSVDQAVIAVPAPLVAKVADECGRKRVRSLVVISDGFKERGEEGAARERELRDIALGHGMRLVGPNCMGVINTDPEVRLNATFSRVYPPPGNVAFLSQSGALGLTILEYASNLNLGISSFASIGNRADVSSNDLLQYWEQDAATAVILLYLESFGNPRKFVRIAKRASRAKPIVAIKGGSTQAGSRAALSHTGALATPVIASDALFSQAGLVRVDTIDELFDVASLMANQPVPRGRRVAIVTNGGGPGILAADACEQRGLLLPEFSADTVRRLKALARRDIRFSNPLDLTAGASAAEFEGTLRVLAQDSDNDAVIVIFIPPVVVGIEGMEDAIRKVTPQFRRGGKPLLACFMGQRGVGRQLGSPGQFVPCYPFPEDAVLALAKAAEYGQWRQRPKGKIPRMRGIRRPQAGRIVGTALSRSTQRPLWLTPDEVTGLLGCYGIRTTETLRAGSADKAAAIAAKIGFPVAVKLDSSTIVHKTDVGGVVLGLKSESEVKQAFTDIEARLVKIGRRAEMQGVVVQRMVTGGIETIVGMTQDPSFGPLIMFGLGGIYAELLKDVVVRLHPLTDLDAREQIGSIKMAQLFEGYRGSPPSDTGALEDLLLRLSAMIEDMPQIAELDLNPVKVMPRGEGYWVLDARIMIR